MNGRWIKVRGNICEDDCVVYKCSVCGEESKWERGMETIYPNDVCPHCFADMLSKRTASKDYKDHFRDVTKKETFMTKHDAIKEIEEYIQDADKAISDDEDFIRGWKSAMLTCLEIIFKIEV